MGITVATLADATASELATTVGTAAVGGAAGAAGTALAGAEASKLLSPHGGIAIPPPPGAAMVDPAGSAASAQVRQRQAVAGGLGSTNIPGANNQSAFGNATSGSKGLLGQ